MGTTVSSVCSTTTSTSSVSTPPSTPQTSSPSLFSAETAGSIAYNGWIA